MVIHLGQRTWHSGHDSPGLWIWFFQQCPSYYDSSLTLWPKTRSRLKVLLHWCCHISFLWGFVSIWVSIWPPEDLLDVSFRHTLWIPWQTSIRLTDQALTNSLPWKRLSAKGIRNGIFGPGTYYVKLVGSQLCNPLNFGLVRIWVSWFLSVQMVKTWHDMMMAIFLTDCPFQHQKLQMVNRVLNWGMFKDFLANARQISLLLTWSSLGLYST